MNKNTYLKAVIILTLIITQQAVVVKASGVSVAVDDEAVLIENSGSNIIDVTNNDTIGKGTEIISVTQPVNGEVTRGVFNVTYQPNSNYCNNGTTTDNFNYTLSGGSTATVSVTVTCLGQQLPPPQTVPINQFHWLLLLMLTIILVATIRKPGLR